MSKVTKAHVFRNESGLPAMDRDGPFDEVAGHIETGFDDSRAVASGPSE
jgi:hypothetical protein